VWVQAPAGPALVCRPLEAVARHCFATRHWPLGVETAARGGSAEGWEAVAREMGVKETRLVRVCQVHGAGVAVVRGTQMVDSFPEGASPLPEADIILSNDSGRAIAIQTADCVPLLLADRQTGAVAAAHAGWRGLAARVPEVVVRRLSAEFGSRPMDVVVAIGPAIGACCYEVGPDVRARFEAEGFPGSLLQRWFTSGPCRSARNPSMASLPTRRRPGHWFFDGWAAARDQFASVGVPASQVHVAELCSASHAEAFCSYRRDGSGAGRMAAAIRGSGTGSEVASFEDRAVHSTRNSRIRLT
jgi:YfiH family protein